MLKTKITEDGKKLRIPVVEVGLTPNNRRSIKPSEPRAGAIEGEKCGYQTVENAPISAIFPQNQLKSLMVIKIDPKTKVEHKTPFLLNAISKGDDTRTHIFSSGKTHYFGSPQLKQEISKFFRSEPDAAVRYGSLFTSNCYEGLETIGPQNKVRPSDQSAIKLKVVDYKQPEDQRFRTDDCFGFCNSALAEKLGAPQDRPFQFRLVWNEGWADQGQDQPFLPSFLSKGVLAVDDELAPDPNQIILDQTSIKGINKGVLDKFVPRGEYELPHAVIGNRENARNTLYRNSWQFTTSFSADAIEKDFGPKTKEEAKRLRELQSDPAMLRRYVVSMYEQSKQSSRDIGLDEQFQDADIDEVQGDDSEDPVMIQLLRRDKLGILNATPKVQDYQKSRLQRSWKELAVNGGHKHQSSRAVPSRELERGEVCIPGVRDGETIIVTRSPIPSKDNIRKYTNNAKVERLQNYKGCIWMNSEDAAEHHQGDFDGDQMQWDFAEDLPNIAKEVKWASEEPDFEGIKQQDKKPYVVADTSVYTDNRESLKQFAPIVKGSVSDGAIGGEQNKVGLVANLIGQIQAAQPNDKDRLTHQGLEQFNDQRHDLLKRLMVGLIVEVDYGKSAKRLEDVAEIDGESLLQDAKSWTEDRPVPFFDYKKDPDVYKHFMMPDTGSKSSVEVMPRITNQAWESLPVGQKKREYFQKVLHSDEELQAASNHPYYEFVKESADEYKQLFNKLVASNVRENLTSQEAAKRIGEFYRECDEFVDKGLGIEGLSPEGVAEVKELFHVAMWQTCHTSQTSHDKRALKPGGEVFEWCKHQPVTFGPKTMQLDKQPGSTEVDVVTAPFGQATTEMQEYLDENNVEYTAYQQAKAPMMDFVLDPSTPQSMLTNLENSYENHSDRVPFNGQVTRPTKYDEWSIPRSRSGTGALAYNVCTPQLLSAVDRQQHLREGVSATGLQHTIFGGKQPGKRAGAVLRVGQYPSDHPYRNLAGQPCLETNGKIVGAFPQNQKVPIVGTAFRAPEFTLKANKKGVVNYAEGDIEQASIYVPLKSSKETEGLTVDGRESASIAAITEARKSAESGEPYSPIKEIEKPSKVPHSFQPHRQVPVFQAALTKVKAQIQMD